MTARPTDWWPLADADPVPGDPEAVSSVATHYSTVAASVRDAAARLLVLATTPNDTSEAVAAFKERAGDVRNDLLKIESRYWGLSGALTAYAPRLEAAQGASSTALVAAQQAHADLAAARWAESTIEEELAVSAQDPERSDDLLRQHRAARARGDAADASLEAARAALSRAVASRDAAASSAIQIIADTEVASAATDTVMDRLADVAGDIAVSLSTFLDNLGEVLEAIAPALAVIELIMLAASFVFPALLPLYGVIKAVSTAVSVTLLVIGAVRLLTSVVKVVTGRERLTWADVGSQAAGYAVKVVLHFGIKKFVTKVQGSVEGDVTVAGIKKLETVNRARGALWNENTYVDLENIRRGGKFVGDTMEWVSDHLVDEAADPLPDAVEGAVHLASRGRS